LPELEQYNILNQIRLTALSTNKHVNFAAVVVDSEAKLFGWR